MKESADLATSQICCGQGSALERTLSPEFSIMNGVILLSNFEPNSSKIGQSLLDCLFNKTEKLLSNLEMETEVGAIFSVTRGKSQ